MVSIGGVNVVQALLQAVRKPWYLFSPSDISESTHPSIYGLSTSAIVIPDLLEPMTITMPASSPEAGDSRPEDSDSGSSNSNKLGEGEE